MYLKLDLSSDLEKWFQEANKEQSKSKRYFKSSAVNILEIH